MSCNKRTFLAQPLAGQLMRDMEEDALRSAAAFLASLAEEEHYFPSRDALSRLFYKTCRAYDSPGDADCLNQAAALSPDLYEKDE